MVLAGVWLAAGCPATDPCGGVNCDDEDACTVDACSQGNCQHSLIDGCCIDDADCDDGSPCTVDECFDHGTDGRVCENTDIAGCCLVDGDCEDGFRCSSNACVSKCTSDGDCENGQRCDQGRGECVDRGAACRFDSECNDGDPCTADSCEGGFCGSAPACHDGLSCTDDNCNVFTGNCSYPSNCGAGKTCNATTRQCEPAVECANDDQCEDDGVFCNGAEICNDEGFCESGGDPCSAGQICNEVNRNCLTPAPQCIDLTTAVETRNGSTNVDRFCAPWSVATNGPTLQTGDMINGDLGMDSLEAIFKFDAPSTVQPTLSSVELLLITDAGSAATTFSAASVAGLTSVTSLDSTNPNALVVSNLSNIVHAGLDGTGSGLTLEYNVAATAGAVNVMHNTLTDVSGGTLNIVTAPNGIESLAIASTGTGNRLDAIVQTTGGTLATLSINGSASLKVFDPLPATLTTVNAGGATGGVMLDLSGAIGNVSFTGGAGNDTITLNDGYSSGDVLNGGGGANTLVITSAAAGAAANPQVNVSGISVLTLSDALAHSATVTHFGTIAQVNIPGGFAAAVALTVGSSTAVNLGADDVSTDSMAAVTMSVAGANATDVLTLDLRDHDTPSLIFNGVETLNLRSNHRTDGALADGGVNVINGSVNLGATATLNVSGAANLTITGVVTAGILNASTLSAGLSMGATSASGITITGGPGNDTLWGSASADAINAGSGSNVIEGRSGVDTIGPLGPGVDVIRINIAGINGTDRKLVSGFTGGVGGDVLNIDADELALLSGSNNFISAAALQTHALAGPLIVDAVVEVVKVTSATVPNFTAANSLNGTNLLTAIGDASVTLSAGGEGVLFVVSDAAGNTGVYLGDPGGDGEVTAAELTLVAVLQGTSLAALEFSNFSNVD